MKEMQVLAEQIAEQLFSNGSDHKADRLVLELPGKHDGGGWCKQAVVNVVLRVLERNQ